MKEAQYMKYAGCLNEKEAEEMLTYIKPDQKTNKDLTLIADSSDINPSPSMVCLE